MELWKDIPGYENLYQASTLGKIRTCSGKTTSNALYKTRIWKQRELKQKVCSNKLGRKDCRVELWKDGEHKTFLVSRLVALTFCEGYFENATVNHKNGNPLDNTFENLEWVSRKENIQKGFQDGLYSSCQKIRLIDLNHQYIDFTSLASCSKYLGRKQGYVSCIKNKGQKWLKDVYGEVFSYELI